MALKRVANREVFKGDLQKRGASNESIFPLIQRMTVGMTLYEDHFLGPVIDTNHYTLASSGTGTANPAISVGKVGGQILLQCGSADDGHSELSGGLNFRGDHGCVMVARVASDNIADGKIEVGFTDVIAGTDAGAVNNVATPTFTATDCALWVWDADDTAYWQGVATPDGNTTPITKLEPSIGPAADTFEYLMVALEEDPAGTNQAAARFILADGNGDMVYDSGWNGLAISDNVLLCPWIFAQNRDAGQDIDVFVDYIGVWQRSSRTA
jgi:hypothetical protein